MNKSSEHSAFRRGQIITWNSLGTETFALTPRSLNVPPRGRSQERRRSRRGDNRMRYHRNTLLAGIAALALVAGTGLASAQESSKDQSPQGKQPHATQQVNHAPAAGKMGQRAQDQNRDSW